MNVKQANIQQTRFVVLKSVIDIVDSTDKIKPLVDLPVEINYEFLKLKENEAKIRVILCVQVNTDKTNKGYYIDVKTGSEYEFSEDVLKASEEYNGLLLYSALPCLINQTRLYLQRATSLFPIKEYILPMIDIPDLLQQKYAMSKRKTIQKAEYRKLKTSNTWHWSRKCSKWPQSNFSISNSKPITGKLCSECKAKENNEQT